MPVLVRAPSNPRHPPAQAPGYTLAGVSEAPVPRDGLEAFFLAFREDVSVERETDCVWPGGGGGRAWGRLHRLHEVYQRAAEGGLYCDFYLYLYLSLYLWKEVEVQVCVLHCSTPQYSLLFAQWRGCLVESANFEVPGFAKGIYLVAAEVAVHCIQ